MKHIVDSRIWLLALVLIMTMTLVACVRPLQDKEEVPATATPSEGEPAVPPEVAPSPTPEDVQPPADGTDTEQPPPSETEQQPAEPGDDSEQVQPIEYEVQEGDTMNIVADRYDVTVEALAEANGITVDAVLTTGQTLVIPVDEGVAEQPSEPAEPTEPAEPEQPADQPEEATEPEVSPEETAPTGDGFTHVVQPGQWLWSIGRLYGCSGPEMVRANPQLPNPHRLYPGDIVFIPQNCRG